MALIRRAGVEDIETLTELRLEFLRESGQLGEEHASAVGEATRAYFARAVPAGEFVAFVAEEGGEIVGTSGLLCFQRPPSQRNLGGREGYVLNMFTRPGWRRQGIASTLLAEIIAFARNAGVGRLLLHASSDGRGIYERAGFLNRGGDMQLQLSGRATVLDAGSAGSTPQQPPLR
jgi:GNAT superfamily N-acetyltransferase